MLFGFQIGLGILGAFAAVVISLSTVAAFWRWLMSPSAAAIAEAERQSNDRVQAERERIEKLFASVTGAPRVESSAPSQRPVPSASALPR